MLLTRLVLLILLLLRVMLALLRLLSRWLVRPIKLPPLLWISSVTSLLISPRLLQGGQKVVSAGN
jgi:hypothetical protein